VQFGDHRVAGAGHLEEGEPARAFIRPHDVRVATSPRDGSLPASVERVVNLGWLSRVVLRLPDDQVLTAEIPNDELSGVEVSSAVFVDLRRAKAFASAEVEAADLTPEMTPTVVAP
jgi:hypothetical protein